MIPQKVSGYVLKNDFRILNRWLNPIGAVIVILLSMDFLKHAFCGQDNQIPHLIAAAAFLGIGIFLLIAGYGKSKILGLFYFCEKDLITNQCSLGQHCLEISHPFFITKKPIAFTMKGTWFEHFLILSGQPFSPISGFGTSGLKAIKNLWENGVIILPDSEEVRIWITQMVGVYEIPQYPKAVYLQQSNSDSVTAPSANN